MTEKSKKTTRRNVGEIILRGRIYYIRYYDGRGRRRLETTKSTKHEDAEKLLRKRLSAKDAGMSSDAVIGKLTLKEATDDLLNDYKVNGRRSLTEVRRKIDLHLLPYFGERRRMTSITTAEMRAFIAERQREEKADNGTITKRAASNAEINRELAALRRAFRLAVRAGRLVQCPHVPMLQERNTRRGFLELDQITAICAALPEELRAFVRRKPKMSLHDTFLRSFLAASEGAIAKAVTQMLVQKVAAKGIVLTKKQQARILAGVRAKRIDGSLFPKTKRRIRIAFTQRDIAKVERMTNRALALLPRLVDEESTTIAAKTLPRLGERWPERSRFEDRRRRSFEKHVTGWWQRPLDNLGMMLTITNELATRLAEETRRSGWAPALRSALFRLHVRACQLG
jgi:hypothetical protein